MGKVGGAGGGIRLDPTALAADEETLPLPHRRGRAAEPDAPAKGAGTAAEHVPRWARVCSRPGCERTFPPRRSGGRPQGFCAPECGDPFDAVLQSIRVTWPRHAVVSQFAIGR